MSITDVCVAYVNKVHPTPVKESWGKCCADSPRRNRLKDTNGGLLMEIEYLPLEENKRLESIFLQNMRRHEPELCRWKLGIFTMVRDSRSRQSVS
jgi:hypothetical protein